MRKNVFGRRFKRNVGQRKALFKSLMSSLVLDEKIRTTEAKAKSIKSDIEKLVTKAKKRVDAERFLSGKLTQPAIDKMMGRIAPQFAQRPGGYTRIVRLGRRTTDSAAEVIMEWTEIIQSSKGKTQNDVQNKKKIKKAEIKKKNSGQRLSKKTTTSKAKKPAKTKKK